MTAYAWDRDDLRGLGVPMEHYLPKPFSPKELVSRVATLIKNGGFLPNSHESVAELQL